MKTNGIILAAGLSSRMKAFKPLLKLKEKTILESSIDSMLYAGVDQIVVVLGFRGEDVDKLLRKKYEASRLTCIYNEKYSETDMFTSVKIGISALNACDAFYLLPGDMPAVKRETFLMIKDAMERTNCIVAFPTIKGQRKHPPLISWKCRDLIDKFHGAGGLRTLWNQLEDQIVTVPVEDIGCTIDADTKEDYKRLVEYMDRRDYGENK